MPSLARIRSLMRGLKWDRDYRHSWPQGEAALQYAEISEDVNHHREIKAELQALGYKYTWQRTLWRASHDSRFVANFSPNLHQEDRPAEEPSAPTPCKGGHHPGAATLCDFMAVARRSKAKAALPLHLKCSGPSSDVQSAHRGAQPRPGPSASSSSGVAPPPAAQQGKVAHTHERVCGVPCNLRVARDQGAQQNAAVDRAVLFAKEAAAH